MADCIFWPLNAMLVLPLSGGHGSIVCSAALAAIESPAESAMVSRRVEVEVGAAGERGAERNGGRDRAHDTLCRLPSFSL